MIDLKKTP